MTFDELIAQQRPEPARPARPELRPRAQLRPPRRGWSSEAGALLGVMAALTLWWVSLGQFRLDDAGNLGILQALPLTFAASFLLLGVLFAIEVSRTVRSDRVLTLIVAALVVVMFSVPNLVDRTGMMPVGYVHAGFTEYISAHHEALLGYDARFSWPAFFGLASLLVSIAGLNDPLPLLPWAPLFFELLALAPMLLLARSILGRGRTAWLGVVLYYCGCWFSQDYFAPQAVDHLLYLSAIAVILWTVSGEAPGTEIAQQVYVVSRDGRRMLRGRIWPRWRGAHPPAGLSDGQAFAIQLALTLIIAAMVVTHQLTPVGFVIQLGVLSVIGATRYRALFLVAGLLTVAWFSYAAADFWAGHLDGLVSNVGKVNNAVNKGLTTRVSAGDPTYLHMQLLRTAWSGGFLVIGGIGGIVLLRRRNPLAVAAGACALSPFLLIGLQSYGGEIFLRCFLYAMPFLGILAAAAISPVFRFNAASRIPVVAILVVAATFGLITARSVNIAFERVSPNSLAAAKFITQVPPAANGDGHLTVGVAEYFAPLGSGDITKQRSVSLGRGCELTLSDCALRTKPQLILLSQEQERFGELRMQLPAGWLMRDGLAQLTTGAGYRVIWQQPGAIVLRSTGRTLRLAQAVADLPATRADSAAATAGGQG